MRQLEVLNNFHRAVATNARIGPLHISLFTALLKLWNEQDYQNPFVITRRALMAISKINGIATYHEKIKDLHESGYILYSPSFSSYEGSKVVLSDLLLL